MKQSAITLAIAIATVFQVSAQSPALWLRYPAISPDGKSIVFSYQGDLYKVGTDGGTATLLTTHDAYDYAPVWSHDGQRIAFASDRYGNMDVFVISANGGLATRLTYHSASEYPTDFTPDNQAVIFSSSQMDAASNQLNPNGAMSELYQIPATGGRPTQLLTTPAELTRFNANGSVMVYQDVKGYEDEFRKHHTSSVTRDVWKYETATKKFTKLTSFEGEDRNPVVAPNQTDIYFLSEKSGSYNIWKMPLSGGTPTQVSRLDKHPVRYLTIANDGTMAFSFNGELYTLKDGGQPRKLSVSVVNDGRYNPVKTVSVGGGASELAVSPNGKEVAYVFRGEVFVSSIKEGTTKRITNTPEQERSISFSPDGRSILYAGERNGSWNVYETSLAREAEKQFFNATLLKEKAILETPAEEFQPAYSPDGKEVAYFEERTTLKVVNLASKASRTVLPGNKNYSYSDGDQWYEWSPDGKWFLVNFLQDNQWISQAGLVAADGKSEVVNLTKSGYNNWAPKWAMGGKAMLWFSDRDGMKNHASWGGEGDAYAMYFTQETFDNSKLSKEEWELKQAEDKEKKEKEDKEKKEKEEKDNKDKKGKDDKKDEKKDDKKDEKKIEPLKIELDDIEKRKTRLTMHSTRLGDAILSKDGEKLFYLAAFEKGFDLWVTELRSKETKMHVKLGANGISNMVLDTTGKTIYMVVDGSITKIGVEDGKREGVNMKGEMVLNENVEREYLFEHMWRQVVKKFYKKDLHGVDWNFYKKEYARFLPYLNNNYDFADVCGEMLGELNASHTGAFTGKSIPNPDQTAVLGCFYDENHKGNGLKIKEIIKKGPLANANSKVKAGTIIEKIDGEEILPNTNWHPMLNRKEGKNTLLSLYNETTKERWEEVVKPIAVWQENELRYQRWIDRCRFLVDSLSAGRVGYVHVRGMDDRSYRTVYEDALGRNANKEALVVDTRFNGGGWLHDDLATFLNGKTYMTFMPREQNIGEEPQFKWRRPSAVVMCEANYSDAHMFPYTYKALGIGKLVGMPVAGTGTAVWWEGLQNNVVFGIPQVGMVGNDGQYLENQQLEPDILAPLDPGEVAKGRDQQLEAAVSELLRQIGGKK
jgi:Tol biopolymer transport system component/C-terminal processing protease CtpA/Prc